VTEEELIAHIRALLGNVGEDVLPDSIITMFIMKWTIALDLEKYPERFNLMVYNTVVDCLRWLIFQEVSSGNASITERFEKIGDETISIKGGSAFKNWQDLLDWLLLNPDYIDPSLNIVGNLVIVGGVRNDEFCRVKNNPNSRNGYSEQGLFPHCRGYSCGSDNRVGPWGVRRGVTRNR
jgi:hypothetical protein